MRYATIVADPPWSFRNAWGTRRGNAGFYNNGDARVLRGPGAAANYKTLAIEQLARLPVGEWAEPNAHLYLWSTNAHLCEARIVAAAWGFRYITLITWLKPQMGMGNYFRGATEPVLFCVRGRLPVKRRDLRNVIEAPRTRHSEKPDAFYELVEQASPGPYLDVFARRLREGWHVYGDDVLESLPLVDLGAPAALPGPRGPRAAPGGGSRCSG